MEKKLLKSGFWVINDAYNANPTSMKSSLQSLKEIAGNNTKIAVLGDMFELGAAAEEKHYKLGKVLVDTGVDYLIGVGKLMDFTLKEPEAGLRERIFCTTHGEALKFLDCLD